MDPSYQTSTCQSSTVLLWRQMRCMQDNLFSGLQMLANLTSQKVCLIGQRSDFAKWPRSLFLWFGSMSSQGPNVLNIPRCTHGISHWTSLDVLMVSSEGCISINDFWHSYASLAWRSKTPTSFYPLKKGRNSRDGNYSFEFCPLHAVHA